MAYTSWTSAGSKHVNSFGSYSKFYLDTSYRYEVVGSTVTYEIKLTARYNNPPSGSGTYDDGVDVRLVFNGSDKGWVNVARSRTWSHGDSYSHTWTGLTVTTTEAGTVPITCYENNSNGHNRFDNPSVSYNITKPAPNEWTVTYNANGGSNAPASQKKKYNEELTLTNATPSWADEILNTYTVTFNGNNGTPFETSAEGVRTKRRTFNNWNTKADGTGTPYASRGTYNTNADLALYAQWNSQTLGPTAVILPGGFRPGGYVLLGWSTSSSATTADAGKGVGDTYTPNADIVLYAVWKRQNAVLRFGSDVWDLIYPVGSIYMTDLYGINPGTLFSGTWEEYTPNPYEGVYMWKRVS